MNTLLGGHSDICIYDQGPNMRLVYPRCQLTRPQTVKLASAKKCDPIHFENDRNSRQPSS